MAKSAQEKVLEAQERRDQAPRKPSQGFGETLRDALILAAPIIGGALFEGSAGAAQGAKVSQGLLQQELGRQQKNAQLESKEQLSREKQEIDAILLDERLEEKRKQTAITPFQKESLRLREKQLNLFQESENRREKALKFREGESDSNRQERVIKEFNKDKIVAASQTALNQANRAKQLLATNNPISAAVVTRALARMSGEVGVMTDKDVESFAGSKALTAQAKQLLEQASTGKLTPENREFMLEIIETMEKVESNILEKRGQQYSEQFGQLPTLQKDKVESLIKPSLPDQPSQELTPRQELEMLRKKHGRR